MDFKKYWTEEEEYEPPKTATQIAKENEELVNQYDARFETEEEQHEYRLKNASNWIYPKDKKEKKKENVVEKTNKLDDNAVYWGKRLDNGIAQDSIVSDIGKKSYETNQAYSDYTKTKDKASLFRAYHATTPAALKASQMNNDRVRKDRLNEKNYKSKKKNFDNKAEDINNLKALLAAAKAVSAEEANDPTIRNRDIKIGDKIENFGYNAMGNLLDKTGSLGKMLNAAKSNYKKIGETYVKRTDENPNAPLTDRTGLNDDQKGPWQTRLESLVNSAGDLFGILDKNIKNTQEKEKMNKKKRRR